MYISDTLKKCEKQIVLILSLLAAMRLFLFSAAFPFFNDVDEWAHFDLVHKYSRGYLPARGEDHFDPEAIRLIVLYGSPEYLKSPQNFKDGKMPLPLWLNDEKRAQHSLERGIRQWSSNKNHEAFSPPAYYFLAGLWYKTGKSLGMEGGRLLYWARLLNIPLFLTFFYLSYFITARFFQTNLSLRLGIPLLLAFFPQDTFYTITNDVLSPLLFTLSFFLLITIYFDQYRRPLFYLMAGLAIAATFLVKYSNIAIVFLFLLIVIMKARELHKNALLKKKSANLVALLAGAGLPVLIWFTRNYLAIGEITGSSHNMELAGYGLKKWSEIPNHPLFTVKGLLFYWHELMKTFWRGELTWHGSDLASPVTDLFYAASSGLFLAMSALYLILKGNEEMTRKRFTLMMSFFVTLLSILFLVTVSLAFDFSSSFYPSAEYPYHRSGRLISGILTPFLILYINGLHWMTASFNRRTLPLFILLLISLTIIFSEISLTKDVFYSRYNWYHLR